MGKMVHEGVPENENSPEEILKRLQATVADLTQKAQTLSELPVIQTEIDSLLAQGENKLDPAKQLDIFKKALELANEKVEKTKSLLPKSKD